MSNYLLISPMQSPFC